eukprot:CAMPEP_0176383462 /NCGR_PEP_ID=MMETSP0126-20121128/33527_1 /TAXON_ID=141414 ORGANISM="Strombidinopsis acuminatum, Strain SPMC142" /NCGR_SAMPLE_ID=MMETSP0126 /ASSEMBLY_ACC=CAM_ASM_000229 /LENGTH=88 /DNA_ID=CAMNT_0017748553 /DNA_START=528 /DNA_END=794 /DNA_ORIENTATION=-
MLNTTNGNESFYVKHHDKVKTDDVDFSTVNVLFMHVKKVGNQVKITHVIDMHPGGKILDLLKTKSIERQQKTLPDLVEYIRTYEPKKA